ncbi:MAG: hypothetical protein NTW87_17670 [Planctomycetota bacterium]|nr:hypothetical protein [Planctomycetota bacterium]
MSLPFAIDDLYAGLAEVRGMLRVQQQSIVLEFKVRDSVVNVVQSDIREVTIPFDQILEVAFRKGWFGFGATLSLKAKSLKALEGVPGNHDAELVVSVARKDRQLAREIASQVNYELSEARMKALGTGQG